VRRARVDALGHAGDELVLPDASAHHLVRVLRQAPGATVELFDGSGARATAELLAADSTLTRVRQLDDPREEAPRPALHLLIGVPKKPAFDLIIRMATELGVSELHPLHLSRCVPSELRLDRVERIAQAAAHQCHRDALPLLHPLRRLEQAIAELPASLDRRIALPGAPSTAPATGPTAVLIGPEGGFTDAEIATALDAGFSPMGLGPLVLRADTACVAAIARAAPW